MGTSQSSRAKKSSSEIEEIRHAICHINLDHDKNKTTKSDVIPETGTDTKEEVQEQTIGKMQSQQVRSSSITEKDDAVEEKVDVWSNAHYAMGSTPLLKQKKIYVNENSDQPEKDYVFADCYYDEAYAVCRVNVLLQNTLKQGSGFLAKYGEYYGMFTNNHVLKEEHLDGDILKKLTIEFKCKDSTEVTFEIDVKNHFRFTCPLLDVTFFKFTKNQYDKIKKSAKIKFLELCKLDSQLPSEGNKILVIQRPNGSECTKFAEEYTEKTETMIEYGFDFTHQVSTDTGSSGSPVFIKNDKEELKVIGIHKCALESANFNVAVTLQTVLNALDKHIAKESPTLILNPIKEGCSVEKVVCGHTLSRHTAGETNWCSYKYDSAKFSEEKDEHFHVWLVSTSHGWYWTATDHLITSYPINWMTATQSKIVGGKYNGYELKNDTLLSIIKELSK